MSTSTGLYPVRLDHQRQQIRVLTLSAGAWSDDLCCSLFVVSLYDKPTYTALSYVWGSRTNLLTIKVNGLTANVTQSLEVALRYLRHPTEDRLLWIDALCINQGDVTERNSQVGLMGKVYRSAKHVLIWLGEADDKSDRAFDLMPTIDMGFLESEEAALVWSFYAATTMRPYMSRVWIIQEFVLATQDPLVVCGHKQVPWSEFMSAYKILALEFFTSMNMVKDDAEGRMPEILAKLRYDLFDELRETVNKEGGADLRQLLWLSRKSESSEPRDRIYGLMQLLDDEDRRYFVVDYNKPIAVIFAEAMSLIFKHGDGPRFLGSMWCSSKLNPLIPNLPSWVLDFTSQTPERAMPSPLSTSFHPPFPRSVSGAGADADNGSVLDDLKTLKVEALHVDIIEDVLCFGKNADDCVLQLGEVERLAKMAKLKSIPKDNLHSFFERYRSSEPLWRTLISDKKWNSGYHAAPDSYESAYKSIRSQRSVDHKTLESDYYRALETHLPRRTFFTTAMGFVGMGMPLVQKGDEITIWFGATAPFAVRQCSDDVTKHTLIGPAYVAGIMEGQLVDELYCEDMMESKTLFVV